MSYSYQFRFYNPNRSCTPQEAASAIQSLVDYGGAWATDYELSGRRYQLDPGQAFDPTGVVETNSRSAVGLSVPRDPGQVDILFQTFPLEDKGAFATLAVDEEYMADAPGPVANLLLALVKVVNLHLPVVFAWGDHELELQRLEPALTFDRVSALAWANLFSPKLVTRMGRIQMGQAPVYQIQAFKQGTLYLLAPDPIALTGSPVVEQVATYFPGCMVSGKHA